MIFKMSDWTPAMLKKWAAALALPALLWCVLNGSGDPALTPGIILFLCITLWAVCAWVMNIMNDVAAALLLPILYVLACGVKQAVVFRPWLGDVAIIVIGGFTLGKIMSETGLGRRIALACVRAAGGSFTGAMCGIGLGAILVSPLVPSIMGKAAIFTAIAMAMCDTLGFAPKSREAAAVMMSTAVSVGAAKLCCLTGGADLVMGMALADDVMGTRTVWMEYALHNFVPGILYVGMSIGTALLVLRVRVPRERITETVRAAYAELGPMTDEQKRALLLLVITLILLATDRFHGVSSGSVLIAVAAVSFLPGLSLMDGRRLAGINFAPLFFIMGCMSIGAAGGELGATDWVARRVLPLLEGLGETLTGVAAYWVGAASNFLLTQLGATSALTAPLTRLGMDLGLEPRILYFAFHYGLDNILLPYEYPLYLYFYSSGYIRFQFMLMVMAARMLLTSVFVGLVAIPWWSLTTG